MPPNDVVGGVRPKENDKKSVENSVETRLPSPAISPGHNKDGKKEQFSKSEKYEEILRELKEDFDRKWETCKPSPVGSLDDYKVLNVVGAGSFGIVRICKHKENQKCFAVKTFIQQNIVKRKQVKHIFQEKKVLHSLNFPFTIHLIFSQKDNMFLYLGMPFINGGELFAYLRRKKKISEKQAKFYGAQVFLALEYIHYMNMIYRDLKPENVLIDNKGYIKLTDFGFCKKLENRASTLCGTPEYLAPEIINTSLYGKSVDWWAFGIFLYEMVAGHSPFANHSSDHMTMYDKIVAGNYKMYPEFSADLKDLITNLLQIDVTKRFGNLKNGSNDIKYHKWFNNVDWIDLLNGEVDAPYVPKTKHEGDSSNFDSYPNKIPTKTSASNHIDYFKDF